MSDQIEIRYIHAIEIEIQEESDSHLVLEGVFLISFTSLQVRYEIIEKVFPVPHLIHTFKSLIFTMF